MSYLQNDSLVAKFDDLYLHFPYRIKNRDVISKSLSCWKGINKLQKHTDIRVVLRWYFSVIYTTEVECWVNWRLIKRFFKKQFSS